MEKNKKQVLGISWMTFFWAQASLMVFSILPVFLAEELKVSYTKIGAIEGLAIGASFATKVISGFLTDYFKRRKPFILLGSFFSLLSKPLFALAPGISYIFMARFFDRASKGVRSAPTDAFIADISHEGSMAARNFNLRQTYCTAGAVLGAFCAMVLLYIDESWFRVVFWVAAIPNVLALIIYFTHLYPKKEVLSKKTIEQSFKFSQISQLPSFFWKFVFVLSFLMVARFSEAFLLLFTREFGCPRECLPLIIITMDLTHSFVAVKASSLGRHFSPIKVLLMGFLVLIVNNFWFYQATTLTQVFVGIAVVGIHMGMTQGFIRSVIAESVPAHLRGSSYALFYLMSGICISFSNYAAGVISDAWGVKYIFVFGAFFAGLAFISLFWLHSSKLNSPETIINKA